MEVSDDDFIIANFGDVGNESVYVLQSTDLLPLAMVMLFDFQDRKFTMREHSTKNQEETLQEVRDLEKSLHRCVCVCLYIEFWRCLMICWLC